VGGLSPCHDSLDRVATLSVPLKDLTKTEGFYIRRYLKASVRAVKFFLVKFLFCFYPSFPLMDFFVSFLWVGGEGALKKNQKMKERKKKIYLLGLKGPQKNSWSGGNEGTLLTVQHILIINFAMSLPPPPQLINNS
jgi:hypothetical protein